jgi:hypothetical protein
MTMHEEWTDQLSDYLDGELPAEERTAVEAHLRTCAPCTAVLNDLKRIVGRARALDARPPQRDLWPAIAGRVDRLAAPRRVSFTFPQLAAAAVLLMGISAVTAIEVMAPWSRSGATSAANRTATTASLPPPAQGAASTTPSSGTQAPEANDGTAVGPGARPDGSMVPVGLADAQYDAAVADLEKALKNGRSRLDKSTVEIVEHNLQIIDQAIAQARDALAADPANAYLSGHLVEARRRKLDLLRRAAELAESD